MKKSLLLSAMILFATNCSAFQIRHTDVKGTTRTYITDTIFVGTGTVADCLLSPFHYVGGFFYFQPYIHVAGSNLSYPSFGGSGCFARGYNKGAGMLNSLPFAPRTLLGGEGHTQQVYFVDMNQKEIAIGGGTIEVTRITGRINFDSK